MRHCQLSNDNVLHYAVIRIASQSFFAALISYWLGRKFYLIWWDGLVYNTLAVMKLFKPQWLVPIAMVASIVIVIGFSDFKF
jgi:hypothetical protein